MRTIRQTRQHKKNAKTIERVVLCLWSVALLIACTQSSHAQTPPNEGLTTTQPIWVKLCSTPNNAPNAPAARKVCLEAHHERLDRQTGMVLISIAIRKVEGMKDPILMLMVPLGMAMKPGLELKFDNEANGQRIPYATCHFSGCTAEAVATAEIVQKMKAGNTLKVTAITHKGRPLLFPIPLKGFTKAYEGPPLDMAIHSHARKTMIKGLRDKLNSQMSAPFTSSLAQ